MTRCVIVCRGLAGRMYSGQTDAPVGQYLVSYDPEFADGRGSSDWSEDIEDAMSFPDSAEAFEFWRAVPKSRPVREDGQPNRPLCAFTVEIVPV